MRHCNAISVACIASIVQQLLQNTACLICSLNRQLRTLVALIMVVFTLDLKLVVSNGKRTAASKVWHFN